MSRKAKNTSTLMYQLNLPAVSTAHYPDGTVELFVHTDPESLDENLPPIVRAGNQALELAKYMARRSKGNDGTGGMPIRPRKPVLTG